MAALKLGASWLDVKLGLRALVKRPGLTFAAVFALAVGIPVGMAPMHLADALRAPLPEDKGDRIRAIRYWNLETNRGQALSYFELSRWREELATFETVGALRSDAYTLSPEGASGVSVRGAEVTATTFGILGAVPLMGRTLGRADERPGAPDVVIVGYDLWQARLAGDPEVVGKTLRVGGVPRTVVGVMPQGFRFPAREQLWLPLREELAAEPGEGRGLHVFGRLTEGVAPETAQAEVTTAGRRMAMEFPVRNSRLRAEVVPFGVSAMNLPRGGSGALPGFFLFQVLCWVILLVSCANVAMLIFARTATRFRELAIRSALGAGRGRIVSQMFVESLVLTLSAAALGLAIYNWMLGRLLAAVAAAEWLEGIPYWFDLGVSVRTVAWALVFALLSAVAVGAVPALMVTGKRVQRSIQEAGTGRSRMRFGGGDQLTHRRGYGDRGRRGVLCHRTLGPGQGCVGRPGPGGNSGRRVPGRRDHALRRPVGVRRR